MGKVASHWKHKFSKHPFGRVRVEGGKGKGMLSIFLPFLLHAILLLLDVDNKRSPAPCTHRTIHPVADSKRKSTDGTFPLGEDINVAHNKLWEWTE